MKCRRLVRDYEQITRVAEALITIAAIATMLVPVLVIAGPFGNRAGLGPGGFGPGARILDHLVVLLDLSEDQEAQLEAIREATKAEIEPYAEQLRAAREAWHEQMQPGNFDEAAVRAFAAQQSELHVEIAVIAARGLSQAWTVLTPEQQQQAQDWMAKMKQRRGKSGFRHHRGEF